MATVWVNGQAVQMKDGEKLNAIEAAQRVGVEVPHYCWHPELTVVASCRAQGRSILDVLTQAIATPQRQSHTPSLLPVEA